MYKLGLCYHQEAEEVKTKIEASVPVTTAFYDMYLAQAFHDNKQVIIDAFTPSYKLVKRAAELGHNEAICTFFGFCRNPHYNECYGNIVKQEDIELSRNLVASAAQKGYPMAIACSSNDGPTSEEKISLLMQASNLGCPEAAYLLYEIYTYAHNVHSEYKTENNTELATKYLSRAV